MELVTMDLYRDADWYPAGFRSLDSPATLILAFGNTGVLDDPAPLAVLAAAFPRSVMLGCSSAGEIHGATVTDDSLSVAIVRFDSTRLREAAVPVHGMDESREAGSRLGAALRGDELAAVLVLSDGLLVNGSELIAGLAAALPRGVVITGGLAGDGDRFQRTWVLHQGKPVSGMVTAVGFYGSRVQVGHGSRGGWDIFGPERVVTRSTANVLYELDGKPALALYKTYLGELASGLPATGLLFPLALRRDSNDDDPVVRTLLAVDEATQSLTFAGNVPEGALVRLMMANLDRLVEGAAGAALMTRSNAGPEAAGPTLCVAISCVGRRLVLGERADDELESALELLPAGTHQVGFYSYGELSPGTSGRCDLHNQTMTLTTIREA
jgi:hypothetical protein